MRGVLVLAALVVVAGLVSLPPSIAAQAEVSIFVLGPDVMAINGNATFNITVTGGPAEGDGGTYNFTVYVDGPDTAGASPQRILPFTGESTSNIRTVNVTAPGIPQSMDLVVNVTSLSEDGSEKEFAQTTFAIAVVRPVTITAKVNNGSNITLEGIDVLFFVDGELVGVIQEDFPALGSKDVSFEWVVKEVRVGTHEAIVKVDLDGDGFADPAKGEVLAARLFYREIEGPNYTLMLVFLLIVLSGLVILFLVRRSLRPK